MRRIKPLSVVAFMAVLAIVAAPRTFGQIGLAVGLNYDSVSDLDVGNVKTTYDAASGYHAGLFYDLSLGTMGLRLGAFYRNLGDVQSDGSGLDDIISDPEVAAAIEHFDLTMIDFPIDVRLNLSATPLIHPYVLVGPVFSIPSSDVDFIDAHLQSVVVTGNVGIGLAINLAGISLFPEFRYAIGISRLLKDEIELGGVSFETDVQRVNSAMLRLGIIL